MMSDIGVTLQHWQDVSGHWSPPPASGSVICISSSLSNSSVVSRLINITSYTCNGRHFLMLYRKMVLNCANVPLVYFFRNEILQLECVRTEQFLSNAWLIKSATNGFYISIISYNYQPLPTKQHLFCQAAGQAEAQVSSWYKTLLLSSKVIQLKWYCPKLKVNCHNSISKIRNVRNVEQHLHFKYKQSNLLLLCSKSWVTMCLVKVSPSPASWRLGMIGMSTMDHIMNQHQNHKKHDDYILDLHLYSTYQTLLYFLSSLPVLDTPEPKWQEIQ